MKTQATRDSGETKPMPELRSPLQLDRTFTPQEYEEIKLGVIPQDMDDKWFIYLEERWLYLHRRTGYCIYQVRLEPAGDGYTIAEAWVNRDSEQYNCTDDKYDADFLLWLIDFVVLGKDVEMPRPPWLDEFDTTEQRVEARQPLKLVAKNPASHALLSIRSWLRRVFGGGRPLQEFGSRTKIYESPVCGRVVEIALFGSQSHEVSSRGRKILEEEVARHRPQYLVINLLGFDSVFGNDLVGALVAGAVAMYKLGSDRETRILAAGRTAAELDRILPIVKLASFFAGRTYPDLESALGQKASSLRQHPD